MNASNVSCGSNTRIVHRFDNAPVNVEIGNGAIAPKVAQVRAAMTVNVECGNGAIAPRVTLKRASTPVNVEIGNGAIAPKVAIARRTPGAKG